MIKKGIKAMRNHIIAGVRCDELMYKTIAELSKTHGGQASIIREALIFTIKNMSLAKFDTICTTDKDCKMNHKLNNTYLEPEYRASVLLCAEQCGGISIFVRTAIKFYITNNPEAQEIFRSIQSDIKS